MKKKLTADKIKLLNLTLKKSNVNLSVTADSLSIHTESLPFDLKKSLTKNVGLLTEKELKTFLNEFKYLIAFPNPFLVTLSSFSESLGRNETAFLTSPNMYSLVKLLLDCPRIHIDVLDIVQTQLLEQLAGGIDMDASMAENPFKLFFCQLKWLDNVENQQTFSEKFLEFMNCISVNRGLLELGIDSVSEIVPDSQVHQAAAWLIQMLVSKPDLLLPIIDALCGMSLGPERHAETCNYLCSSLQQFTLQELPVVLKFLFSAHPKTSTTDGVIKAVLEKIKLEQLVDEKATSEWRVLQEVLASRLASSPQLQTKIIQWCSSSSSAITSLQLLCLLSMRGNMKRVEKTLLNKIIERKLAAKTANFVISKFAPVSPELTESLIEIASSLLHSPLAVHQAFKRTGNAIAAMCVQIYESLIIELNWKEASPVVHALVAHIGSGSASQANAALQCLERVSTKAPKQLAPFVYAIKTLLDSISLLLPDQVFSIFTVLAELSHRCELGLFDELQILVRKWLTLSPEKGCMAGLALLLQALSCDSGEDNPSFKIFDTLYNSVHCKHMPLFYDEFAERFAVQKSVCRPALERINEQLVEIFTNEFCCTADDVRELPDKLTIVGHLDGDESETCIRIAGSSAESYPRAVLPSFLKLLAACSKHMGDSKLESLDALLGAGIVWDDCDDSSKKAELAYYTICWYKECINVFCEAETSHSDKIAKRLDALPELHGVICAFLSLPGRYAEPRDSDLFAGIMQQSQLEPYFRKFKISVLAKLLLELPSDSFSFAYVLPEWKQLVIDAAKVLCNSSSSNQHSLRDGSSLRKKPSSSSGGLLEQMNGATTWPRLSVTSVLEYLWSPAQKLADALDDELKAPLIAECFMEMCAVPADSKRLDKAQPIAETVCSFLESTDSLPALVFVPLASALTSLREQSRNVLTTEALAKLWDIFWSKSEWSDWAAFNIVLPAKFGSLSSLAPLYYFYAATPLDKIGEFVAKFASLQDGADENVNFSALPLFLRSEAVFWIYRASFTTLTQVLLCACEAAFGSKDSKIATQSILADFSLATILKRAQPSYLLDDDAVLTSDMLSTFSLCTKLFSELVNQSRNYEGNKQCLMTVMRHGRQFVDIFRQQVIPKFLKPFLADKLGVASCRDESDESRLSLVQQLIRHLQTGTRLLQTVCGHAKASKDSGLTTLVPALRKSLELLLYEVKFILQESDYLGAFWVGNLKHKSLQGAVLASQMPVEAAEVPETEAATECDSGIINVGAAECSDDNSAPSSDTDCSNKESPCALDDAEVSSTKENELIVETNCEKDTLAECVGSQAAKRRKI